MLEFVENLYNYLIFIVKLCKRLSIERDENSPNGRKVIIYKNRMNYALNKC
jgi:hypothetical protein